MEGVFKFWQNVEKRAKSLMPPQVFPAVVKKVDKDMRTCTVRINDNVDIEDVRLYAVSDDSLKGFCLIPAIDSTVLVGAMDGRQDFYVVMFSEVDKVLGSIGDKTEIAIDEKSLSYKCDKTEITVQSAEMTAKIDGVEFGVKDNKVKVNAEEIVFNDGKNDGLIKIKDLTAKLNGLVDSFNNHTHTIEPVSVPGTGLTTPTGGGKVSGIAKTAEINVPAPATTVQAASFDKKDYEDTIIKH